MSVGFQEFPQSDSAVRAWFNGLGWPVTMTHHDFDRDVFAWRHERPGTERTLRITQSVLEDVPPHLIAAMLDGLQAAERLNSHPQAYTIIMRENGEIILRQLDAPPTRK